MKFLNLLTPVGVLLATTIAFAQKPPVEIAPTPTKTLDCSQADVTTFELNNADYNLNVTMESNPSTPVSWDETGDFNSEKITFKSHCAKPVPGCGGVESHFISAHQIQDSFGRWKKSSKITFTLEDLSGKTVYSKCVIKVNQ